MRLRLPIARIIFAPVRRRFRGLTTYGTSEGRTIEIDPRSARPARILLHEYLHILHPKWSEKRVHAETWRQWKRLTWCDVALLYKRLGTGRVETTYEDED